jgi:tetratricopeptide (TPR) repeat protein
MKRRNRPIVLAFGLLLLAGAAAAFLLAPRREVTTKSEAAYREYLAGREDAHRIYIREARHHFEAALKRDPHFVMAKVSLASLGLADDPSAAKAMLADANRDRDRVTRRERLVLDLMRAWSENRLKDASTIAVTLKNDYHDERAYSFLGPVASSEGKVEQATALYREWLEYEPNNANSYNLLGYTAAYKGDFDEAVADLKKYAFLAPDEANPFDSLGEIEAACGRYEDAVRDLRKALSIKPDFFPSYEHLGVAYDGLGDFAAARSAFEKAIEGSSSPAVRRNILAELFFTALHEKDYAFARQVLERRSRLVERKPGLDSNPILEAVLVCREGRPQEAAAKLDTFKLPEPGDPSRAPYQRAVSLVRGLIALTEGRLPEAATALEASLVEPGRDGSLQELSSSQLGRALLARVRARQGDLAEAERLIGINRRFNPKHRETREVQTELEERKKAA